MEKNEFRSIPRGMVNFALQNVNKPSSYSSPVFYNIASTKVLNLNTGIDYLLQINVQSKKTIPMAINISHD